MKYLGSTCTFHIISTAEIGWASDDNYFIMCKFSLLSQAHMTRLNNHCRMEAVTDNGQIYSPLSKTLLWDLVGSPRNKIIRGSGLL